ncbi:MAG: acetyl-CoA carboxylase biotin carboxylase subunit [Candidatus Flexifilum sp.]
MMIRACLIANRGEIAVRIIRACRELGIRACVAYSDADADSLPVRLADAAWRIGPPAPAESYLNIPALVDAARALNCDAVHPGYGFLAENAAFARAVLDAGLIWIGPPPEAIRAMGSKTEARALMQAAGVPVVPGYQPDDAPDSAYRDAADAIGYPVLVKAAGGGGGRGIRIVRTPDDLPPALAAARREAESAFGDARVFLEKYIEQAHHVEVQVLADAHGQIRHLFERECSAQRRHQKVIEESPSPLVSAHPGLRERLCAAAVDAARAVGYVNAGTVEFIASPAGDFYFLEMNTRLQVEHPVTEMVTGIDLVKAQFAIAAGERLTWSQADLAQRGHAVELRLYAEDARAGFLPAAGMLVRFTPPAGAGVRVDAGYETGEAISPHYDALIAKIIVHGETRADALQRAADALAQTEVVGVTTNLPLLRGLVAAPDFAAGAVDTAYIERHLRELLPVPPDPLLALAAAALFDSGGAGAGPLPPAFRDPWSTADSFRIGEHRA